MFRQWQKIVIECIDVALLNIITLRMSTLIIITFVHLFVSQRSMYENVNRVIVAIKVR